MPAHPHRLPLTVLVAASLLAGFGCSRTEGEGQAGPDMAPGGKCVDGMPCTDPAAGGKTTGKTGKVIWANSHLFYDAPPIDVQTWLNGKPELAGKMVLIEFWRTWCGACKRTVPLLNSFHEKYGKELVVISITGEPEETVKAYSGPAMKYFMAIDKPCAKTGEAPVTDPAAHEVNGEQNGEPAVVIKDQGVMESAFGVWGWPHVVLLEPENHCVIWEGFPLLAGYELTAEKIERALAVARDKKTLK